MHGWGRCSTARPSAAGSWTRAACASILEPIPTWLVLRDDTGLIGAAHYRHRRLRRVAPSCRDSAFWRFSLELYARDGVPAACLALQDREGADVNLVLLALWLGESGGIG